MVTDYVFRHVFVTPVVLSLILINEEIINNLSILDGYLDLRLYEVRRKAWFSASHLTFFAFSLAISLRSLQKRFLQMLAFLYTEGGFRLRIF